ncbi:hypothetical protein, partial [Pseudomonas urmiensis]|uniref:hypothetical protein n=1 Tax=Pseudomonas urmiensis TaxID=2745493 RepID=UPI0034D4D00E
GKVTHYSYAECNRVMPGERQTENDEGVTCENCLAILEHAHHYKDLNARVEELMAENQKLLELAKTLEGNLSGANDTVETLQTMLDSHPRAAKL